MKVKCLLVDDEPLALNVLEEYIKNINEFEIIAKCESAVQAFEILRKQKIDLIFLDIQMPMLSGVQFLKSINKPPKVIFTTAYKEYAVEGFELDATDYLVKPISFERFLKAVGKYFKLVAPEINSISTVTQQPTLYDQYLLVKVKKKLVKVILSEILFIESLKDYIKIHMKGKSVVTKMFISEIEEKLPSDLFLRIQRSFIVAMDKIDSFSPNNVEINEHEIPIGRSYKNLVFKHLMDKRYN